MSDETQAQGVARAIASVAAILCQPGRNAPYAGTQWIALRFIASRSAPTAQAIANFHDLDKTTIAPVVTKLSRANHIKRQQNPKDRRSYILQMTPSGHEALNKDPLHTLARPLSSRCSVGDLELARSAISTLAQTSKEWFPSRVSPRSYMHDLLQQSGDIDSLAGGGALSVDEAAVRAQSAYLLSCSLSLLAPGIERAGATDVLTRPQWNALRYFADVNPSAATVSAYAGHRGIRYSAAAYAINELIEKNLLAVKKNPTGLRGRYLFVTEEGRLLMKADPNLKIAKILQKHFDTEALSRIGMVLHEILTIATATKSRDSKSQRAFGGC